MEVLAGFLHVLQPHAAQVTIYMHQMSFPNRHSDYDFADFMGLPNLKIRASGGSTAIPSNTEAHPQQPPPRHHTHSNARRFRLADYVPRGMTDIAVCVDDINDFMLEQAMYESLPKSAGEADSTTTTGSAAVEGGGGTGPAPRHRQPPTHSSSAAVAGGGGLGPAPGQHQAPTHSSSTAADSEPRLTRSLIHQQQEQLYPQHQGAGQPPKSKTSLTTQPGKVRVQRHSTPGESSVPLSIPARSTSGVDLCESPGLPLDPKQSGSSMKDRGSWGSGKISGPSSTPHNTTPDATTSAIDLTSLPGNTPGSTTGSTPPTASTPGHTPGPTTGSIPPTASTAGCSNSGPCTTDSSEACTNQVQATGQQETEDVAPGRSLGLSTVGQGGGSGRAPQEQLAPQELVAPHEQLAPQEQVATLGVAKVEHAAKLGGEGEMDVQLHRQASQRSSSMFSEVEEVVGGEVDVSLSDGPKQQPVLEDELFAAVQPCVATKTSGPSSSTTKVQYVGASDLEATAPRKHAWGCEAKEVESPPSQGDLDAVNPRPSPLLLLCPPDFLAPRLLACPRLLASSPHLLACSPLLLLCSPALVAPRLCSPLLLLLVPRSV
eukprot:gene6137-2744_t